jgi:hypothetical protein
MPGSLCQTHEMGLRLRWETAPASARSSGDAGVEAWLDSRLEARCWRY